MRGKVYWVCRRCGGKEFSPEFVGVENTLDKIMSGQLPQYAPYMHHPCKDGNIGVIELTGAEVEKEGLNPPMKVEVKVPLPEVSILESPDSSTHPVEFSPPVSTEPRPPVGPRRRGRPSAMELASLKID